MIPGLLVGDLQLGSCPYVVESLSSSNYKSPPLSNLVFSPHDIIVQGVITTNNPVQPFATGIKIFDQ